MRYSDKGDGLRQSHSKKKGSEKIERGRKEKGTSKGQQFKQQ